MDERQYVPILKGREGEYRALAQLEPAVRAGLMPVIEIPSVPWDFVSDSPARTIDAHLQTIGRKLREAWPGDRALFADLLWIAPEERMADGRQPVSFVFDAARQEGVKLVPVTGLERGDDYHAAVREIIARDRLGLMLRLDDEQLTDLASVPAEIGRLLDQLGVAPRDVDVIVDLREVSANQEA